MGDHKHKKEKKPSSKKREHKESRSERDHKKHKKISSRHKEETEIDYSDPSLWVEAGGGAEEITPAEHLRNIQQATEARNQPVDTNELSLPQEQEARHGWMLGGGFDFGSMGTARVREEDKPKPNPDEFKVSERELNQHLVKGLKADQYPEEKKPTIKFGDAGSNWRMMKLKRTMEQAKDEARSLQEVGIEKYGSAERFQEALDEREYLDNKKAGRSHRRGEEKPTRRYVFNDTETQKKSFRRPDPPAARPRSPPPSIPLPQATVTPVSSIPATPMLSTPPASTALTRDQLNKLNAKLVKAKLMGANNVEELEREYQAELDRFEQTENSNITVLPTFDNEGRIYDYALNAGNQGREGLKGKKRFEGTHDKVTGERLRYGTSDDTLTLAEMIRQEKGGSRTTSDMDLEFAKRIVADQAFESNLDYMDEKADVMASKKGMSEEQKMRRAVSDYKRTQDVLGKCKFCYHDNRPPQMCMISLATTCYLALPGVHEITPGNCLIVPLQHVSSMLECDDDVWTEVRNFQKCLMKMFHAQNKGCIFMETVVNLRSQRHTAIEVIPVPYGVYEDAPAYFKEGIMGSDEEWSQHKKLIDTSSKGFRYSMVKNLPYFHVWFGLDKGYGHVIENAQRFPYWFGKEIVAGMMDIGPELWRRPKHHYIEDNPARQEAFMKDWQKWDWTVALK
ncbi:CwfJ C-terminus 1-domain-containing protein-like protein [Gilbertella persicaria]|uniref:CwfJ C-terminus 1-domain-containing protein-like protein n=1 Tax=Gilbertella persicaria TaxID=101096 RepID=UPI00221FA168|nr:CwfJ C-terminus 1-domain-containing protein-like protein [Gilbertella persicaria]KAI8048599.1 CwfJ C-terminus 1-domain-containing protein-like protein [Gilbertella persicaria]